MTSNSLSTSQTLPRSRGLFQAWADLSLRNKFIVILLVLTLVSVGAVAFLNNLSTTVTLTSQVGGRLESVARSQGLNIGTVMARTVDLVQSFSLGELVRDEVAGQNADYSGDKDAIQAEIARLDEQWVAASDDDLLVQEHLNNALAIELKRLKGNFPNFAEIFVTDRYGALAATSDRTSDYYQADEGWWQAAFSRGQGAIYIGEPEFDESTGVLAINIAVPLYGQNGREVIGVLRTTYDMTALGNLLEAAEVGEESHVHLLFQGGQLLSAEGSGIEVLDPATQAQLDTIVRGYREMLFGGQPSLVSQAAVLPLTGEEFVSELGWKVIVYQVREQALLPVGQQTRNAILLALLVAGVAVVVGIGMGRLLAAPLAQLTAMVKQFTEGDLTARVQIGSGDETGVLATNFNAMADQVSSLLTGLETRGHELEERTREMEASQRVTFAASERTSPDALLDLVVNLIRDLFHLYHVQVYLVDEERGAAVLRKSTGYAGRRLLARKHHIPLDRPALVTKAVHEGEPVLVADVSQDPDFLPNPLLPHTQSELAVPLRVGEEVIGVLDVQDRTPGRFTEDTVALFQAMTNQIAFLFENSDLLERVTDQGEALAIFATQLRTAADVARQLGAILDPERLLQQVVDLMQSRFGLYHAHIYVLEAPPQSPPLAGGRQRTDGRRLVVHAGSGEVGRVLRERRHAIPFEAEKSLVARAAREQGAVVVDDTSLVSDFMPNPLLPQTRSEMAVPLVFGDKVLGVLDMQDDHPGRFAEAEVDTFSTLAGQIATALQTAGFFAGVQARFRVSQALAGTQTEDDVLDAMVQAAGFYPQVRVSIYTFGREALADDGQEGRVLIARRDEPFESGIVSRTSIGTRLTSDQLPLLDLVSADTPFMSSNLSLDERVDPARREMAGREGAVSLAILPVTAGNEWLGIVLAMSKGEGFFDERKLYLYQTLVEQGAMALRTGRLFDESLQTAERLRELDRLKSEFLASMSHELRTPLNSILGYTEVMLMGIDGELDPETREDVQAVYDNGRHLLNLINDILDLAKIEAGRLVLSIEEVQLGQLIDAAHSSAVGLLISKPVELTFEVEEDLPPIQGDSLRLNQILNNILSNAAKFTEEGSITLRAYYDRPDWVCIEVEDTGIGISQGDLEKVFDRFHRVDSSESRRTHGTGLGLAITHQLVELHGGTIEVQSELGKGSIFIVRLPVQTPD